MGAPDESIINPPKDERPEYPHPSPSIPPHGSVLYDNAGQFAGVRLTGSGRPIDVEGMRLTIGPVRRPFTLAPFTIGPEAPSLRECDQKPPMRPSGRPV